MGKIILSTMMFLLCIQIYGQRTCGSELNLTELQQTDIVRLRFSERPRFGGRVVLSKFPLWGIEGASVNVSHLPAGIYIVNVGDKTAKFVKK